MSGWPDEFEKSNPQAKQMMILICESTIIGQRKFLEKWGRKRWTEHPGYL